MPKSAGRDHKCDIDFIIIIIIRYIYIALFWVLKALYIEGGNLLIHQVQVSSFICHIHDYTEIV